MGTDRVGVELGSLFERIALGDTICSLDVGFELGLLVDEGMMGLDVGESEGGGTQITETSLNELGSRVDGDTMGNMVGSLDLGDELGSPVDGDAPGVIIGLLDVGVEIGSLVDGEALGDVVGSLDVGFELGFLVDGVELGSLVDGVTLGDIVGSYVVGSSVGI